MAANRFERIVFIILWSVMVFGVSCTLQTRLPTCPKDCKCIGTRINCSRRNLRQFPKGIPSSARVIDFSNNQISKIDLKELSRFTRLKALILHHNNLNSLPPWSKFPTTLTTLSLHHNKITVIPSQPNSTREINLRKLVLSHNSISRIDENAFSGINPMTLQVLKLNRNLLENFPTGGLQGLRRLRVLDLTRNKIQNLTAFFLPNAVPLKTLRLSKNRITTIQFSAFLQVESSLQNLYLDHNNLSSITTDQFFGLVHSLQQLLLNDNQISEINSIGKYKWSSCCNVLSNLDLARNKLKRITSLTFSELLHVKSLNLSGNQISNIAGNAFSQLKLLRNLDLSNNRITWSSLEGNSGTFSGLDDLQTLRLDHNRITTVARDAFTGLRRLVSMNLSANIISSIQEGAFAGMIYLTKLHLDTKNLHCDCKLKWFPRWVETRRTQGTAKGICLRPENLSGRSIYNVSTKYFVCGTAHPAPKITVNPKINQKAVKGSNVTMGCIVTVVAKNDSRLTLLWKRNSLTVQSVIINTGVADNRDGIKAFSNELRLSRVTRKDDGYYQCGARNAFGEDQSKTAQLSILVRPKLVKIPQELTVHVGEVAKLSCSATGHPKPQIRWRKDGGEKFPAAQERRLRHLPPDDYIIRNAKPEDMGEYSCFAENEVGIVNASASLTVLDIPRIIKKMKSQTVKIGKSVVFECMVSGSPPPTFVWLKDNKIINKTARFISATAGQLCLIVRVEEKHAGKYTCRVSNNLGHEEQTAYLKVIEGDPEPSEEKSKGNLIQHDKKTFLGIIVIVVVACVIGTSIVWLIVIFCAKRSDKKARHSEVKLAVEARDDISYLRLKSSSSGSTQASRDSPRSTATFLTSAESQGTSAFPRSTSGSEVASSCDKASSGDILYCEISPKGSGASLNTSSPSNSITHFDQRMVVKAQVHSSSDSDSDRVSRTSSPCRKKNTKDAKSKEETIPLNECHTNPSEKTRCKIATLDGIYEEVDGKLRSCKNFGVSDSNSSRLNSTDSNSSV